MILFAGNVEVDLKLSQNWHFQEFPFEEII